MPNIYAIQLVYQTGTINTILYKAENQQDALEQSKRHRYDGFDQVGDIILAPTRKAKITRRNRKTWQDERLYLETTIVAGYLAYIEEDGKLVTHKCKTDWSSSKKAHCTIYQNSHKVEFF